MINLIWTPKFKKSADKFIKQFPEYTSDFKHTIINLEENPHNPLLRAHKLKGPLLGLYACSINYSYRIVFDLREDEKTKNIILINIGSHEEVY